MRRWTAVFLAAIFLSAIAVAARPDSRLQTNAATQEPGSSPRFAFGGNAAQIPAKFIGHLVLLPVRINLGQPSLFELDSTAAVSSVDPDRAAELGLGNLRAPVLNLSGVDIALSSLSQTTKKDFGPQVGRSYEGTLGQDVFEGTIIEVDYARQTVRFYDPASYQYSGQGKSFHLDMSSGVPVMKMKFSVTGGKVFEGDFVVNTALDTTMVISEKFNQSHHVLSSRARTTSAAGIQSVGGPDAVFARVKFVDLGSFTLAEAIAAFSQIKSPADSDGHLAGEIGGGLLRRFTVIFDFPHQQMILDSNRDFHTDDREDMSGLSIIASGPGLRRFEVIDVRHGTPGADGGIQKGDVIAGINDEAAADITLAEIRDLFSQVGHKYKILIERNGQTLPITIQMRRLI
jgi:PDZ domain